MLADEKELIDIAEMVVGDNNLMYFESEDIPQYICNCSKEKMETGLSTIGEEALKEIIENDEKAELVCHFCNKKYVFNKEELNNILNKIKK